jgi:hypothetical protein
MRTETPPGNRFQGSQSSTAYTPGIHGILPNAFTGETTGPVPASPAQTLGASELARASERQYMDLLRDFSESASFQRDPALVRSLCGRALPIRVTGMAASDTHPAFRAVAARIRAALEAEPVEDGYTHPAETDLAEMTRNWGQVTRDWLSGVIAEGGWPRSLAAGLLRLLGRQRIFTGAWRLRVIQLALSSPAIELRDAGVQAAESWGDPAAVGVLQAHAEPCAWLADYIERVIRDLTT